MNVKYEGLRLWLHYFWLLFSVVLTSLLYTFIFLFLQRKQSFARPPSHSSRSASIRSATNGISTRMQSSGHHPAFLIYPVIYILCTAPLALGRVVSMTGKDVSVAYFCAAGAMIASNGWLDVLVFSTTRHSIIFNASPDSDNTGLETFAFMRTPHWRQYGNMIWVQGGARGKNGEEEHRHRRRREAPRGLGKITQLTGWGRRGRGSEAKANSWFGDHGSGSQESLRGSAGAAETGIQMDTVTTVVIESARDSANISSREPSSHSVDSSEKIPAGMAGTSRP